MNQSNQNKSIEKLLEETAESVNASPNFVASLEDKLMNAHKPRKVWALSSLSLGPALGWSLAIIALALAMNWVRSLAPQVTGTGDSFVCPVTSPNGSMPPSETVPSPDYLGNDELWTGLWPDGKIYMLPENQRSDGSFDMKWPWWRGVSGALSIEGHRLDADAGPLSADIPDGYGDTGFQVSGLIFPTTGCWEVTGRVGDSSLTFVTEVVFGDETPTPDVSIPSQQTPVAADNSAGYNFRGGKLILAQPLPDSPLEANVYLLSQEEQQATVDEVHALAERFGVAGELYNTTGRVQGSTAYMVTDGRAQLIVYSPNSFTYTSDLLKSAQTPYSFEADNAESTIRGFLSEHGFDFPIRVSKSELYGTYQVEELAPDGYPMNYEYFSPSVMNVKLDESGQVLSVDALLISFDSTPQGTYGIIPVDAALQIVLDESIYAGKIESSHSGVGQPPQNWYREYPDNQIITTYGLVSSSLPVDSGIPPIIFIDNVQATGNTKGLEGLEPNTFVAATGQYLSENGIRKFQVESWTATDQPTYASGSLHRQGDQIILTSDDGSGAQYPLIDPPADAPLDSKIPDSQLSISGVILDGKMFWTNIQFFPDSSQMGGGGGGGGLGFYKLNLSGTPIAFPTSTPFPTPVLDANSQQYIVAEGDTLSKLAQLYNVSINDIMQANGLVNPSISIGQSLLIPPAMKPTTLDGVRGMLVVSIISNGDGTQRTEYGFLSANGPSTEMSYMVLHGENLDSLSAYTNKPLKIWGTTDHVDPFGVLQVSVERTELPYPDLQPQILKGTESIIQLEGKEVVLFTTQDGQTFAEYQPNCFDTISMQSMAGTKNGGPEDKSVLVEALAVPDLSLGDYPGMCIFSTAPATQSNGDPFELPINSNQPQQRSEGPDTTIEYTVPDLTIDQVELVYLVSDAQFRAYDLNAPARDPQIQPVWHFHGFYADGTEFDVVVQALKREFLSPELAPSIPPG